MNSYIVQKFFDEVIPKEFELHNFGTHLENNK